MQPSQAPAPPPESQQLTLQARVITGVIVVAVLQMVFRFATKAPYRAEMQVSFFTTVAITTVLIFAAGQRPRLVGHALGGLFGLGWFVTGVGTLLLGWGDLPVLLSLVLLITGGSVLATCHLSFFRRSRAAWAFLSSTLGVMAVCTLFGAPSVRNLSGLSMWTALLLPGVLTAATLALGFVAHEYREGATPRR